MTLNDHDFRHCLGSFSTGVTVVTTANDAKDPQGITVNSFCSVSLHPPLILFCLDKNASCFETLHTASHFTINILSEAQEDLSHRFAHYTEDRWKKTAFHYGKNGCPTLENCTASLECKTSMIHEAGDHFIIIGEVLDISVSEQHPKPLIYYRSNYYSMTNDIK